MKRAVLVVGLAAFWAAPAAAQLLGQPIWNNPKGGTGITFYGDYGKPNADPGQGGSAYGGRVALGSGSVTITAGVASWKPEASTQRVLSYGGTAEARLIGGSLLPVNVNLQLGGAYNAKVTSGIQTLFWQTTTGQGALGFSVVLPTPVISVEPYVSPGVRYHKYWNVPPGVTNHDINFGWVVGGNLNFGPLGVHVAYDSEKVGSTTRSVFGVGASLGLRVPLGT
jgi:hypothetical protein